MLMLQIEFKRNVTNAIPHLLLMVHYGIMFGYHTRGFFSQGNNSSSKMDNVKQCPESDKEITKRNLWSHMKEVHKLTNSNTAKAEVLVYAFKCEMCSFSTKRKHDLKRHVMRKHSDVDVSFLCALCDKTFQYEQSLKKHMKCHETSD